MTYKFLISILLLLFSQTVLAQQHCQYQSIPATSPISRFEQVEPGNVIDKHTGLMWRTCLEGVAGDECNQGKPLTVNWAVALQYLPKINTVEAPYGYRDWRLPNIRELSSLVELQCTQPAINMEVFPHTPPIQVWTSSPYSHFDYAWYVDFADGRSSYIFRTEHKALRLVRDVE